MSSEPVSLEFNEAKVKESACQDCILAKPFPRLPWLRCFSKTERGRAIHILALPKECPFKLTKEQQVKDMQAFL